MRNSTVASVKPSFQSHMTYVTLPFNRCAITITVATVLLCRSVAGGKRRMCGCWHVQNADFSADEYPHFTRWSKIFRHVILKREVQRDLRTAYWEYIADIALGSNGFSNMKRFRKFIKHQATDFHGVSPLKVDGKLVRDPKLKAEALNSQFQRVFTHKPHLTYTVLLRRFH